MLSLSMSYGLWYIIKIEIVHLLIKCCIMRRSWREIEITKYDYIFSLCLVCVIIVLYHIWKFFYLTSSHIQKGLWYRCTGMDKYDIKWIVIFLYCDMAKWSRSFFYGMIYFCKRITRIDHISIKMFSSNRTISIRIVII